MRTFDDFYEDPADLTPELGHHRIFSPRSYRQVRERNVVPIAIVEGLAMAAWHPICWRKTGEKFVASALRCLLPDGGLAPGAATTLAALPLILRAYPFIPHDGADRRAVIFDRAIADAPTDSGAPILSPDGKMTKGALYKRRAAVRFTRAIVETEALSEGLASSDLLTPWPLDFDLGPGLRVRVDHLWVLRSDAWESDRLLRLIRRAGGPTATFLAAHRISLFRIAALLRAARASAVVASQSPAEAAHA